MKDQIESLESGIQTLKKRRADLSKRIEDRTRAIEKGRQSVIDGEEGALATATNVRTERAVLQEEAEALSHQIAQEEQRLKKAKAAARKALLESRFETAVQEAGAAQDAWLTRLVAFAEEVKVGLKALAEDEEEWREAAAQVEEISQDLGYADDPNETLPKAVRNVERIGGFKTWAATAEHPGWPQPENIEDLFSLYRKQGPHA